jgi:hypothetical protein
VTTTNLLANPGFATGALAPWTETGCTAAVETGTVQAGTYAAQVTPGGAAAGPELVSGAVPVNPGNWINIGGYARGTAALAHQVRLVIIWKNGAGAVLSTVAGAAATLSAGAWTSLSVTGQAPAGAASASCAYQYAGTSVPAAAEVSYFDSAWLSPLLYYDPVLSRVRVDPAVLMPLLAGDDTARIQSSPTGVMWTTVRGGLAAAVSPAALPVDDYEFPAPDLVNYYQLTLTGAGVTYSDSIVAPLGGTPWLKNIAQPFTNMPVALADATDITRPTRGSSFAIVGQELPIAISTARGGRQFTLTVYVTTDQQNLAVQAMCNSGDTLLLQIPAGYATQDIAGYYTAGDTVTTRQAVVWPNRWIQIPLTEVVPPGPDVIPATSTWQTVTATYPTWAAVVAAQPSWSALIETVGAPADVFVA